MFKNTDILWIAFVLLVILSIAALLPVTPNDYWWYVRLGSDIVWEQAIPTVDTYSWTQIGQPFTYHSWLSAVIFYSLYQFGGITVTVLLRIVLIGVFYFVVWRICRLTGAGPRLAAISVFVAALASSNNWAIRPQMFSYPLFGMTLLSLWQWQLGRDRWVWVLPGIMILWVNLHGAYVVELILIGAALVGGGGDRKKLGMALLVTMLAVMINPRGPGAWAYVFNLLNAPSVQQIATEWQPPTHVFWQTTIFFAWLLAFPLIAYISEEKLSITHWLWYLGFGWLALGSLRHLIWMITIMSPLSAHLLNGLAQQTIDRRVTPDGIPAANGVLFAVMILLPVALLPGIRQRWWNAAPPDLTATTPVEATAWLEENPHLPGPIWSDLAYSSYLIYALPERPVWSDPRLELYPFEQWERYIALSDGNYQWQAIFDEQGINLVMADEAGQLELINAMSESSQWEIVYSEGRTTIFARANSQPNE